MIKNLTPLPNIIIEPLIRRAFEEDLGRGGDITTDNVIPIDKKSTVEITARGEGIVAGISVAELSFKLIDPNLKITQLKTDGVEVKQGDVIIKIEGNSRAILTAERTALNFLGRMSGIATLTNKMVKEVGNYKMKVSSTRKTTPGMRALEKYAVKAGGGFNHRLGLDVGVMIKDNHIAIAGSITKAIRSAKENIGHMVKIECEVDNLEQLKEVLEEGVDIIMLDNMSIKDMTTAIEMIDGRATVEASGNITLERIAEIAAIGIDLVSVGALTHSAPNFDIGLDFVA